jgi:hypothetical protein
MHLWIMSLLRNWKVLVGIAAVGAIIGLGVWVYSTGAENASLKARTALLEGAVQSLESQLQMERAATRQAQDAAREARSRASTSRKGIENARRSDPVVEDWYNQSLPAGIADSLR